MEIDKADSLFDYKPDMFHLIGYTPVAVNQSSRSRLTRVSGVFDAVDGIFS